LFTNAHKKRRGLQPYSLSEVLGYPNKINNQAHAKRRERQTPTLSCSEIS